MEPVTTYTSTDKALLTSQVADAPFAPPLMQRKLCDYN